MHKLRTLDQIENDYFRQHPEEIEEYISVIFEEYAKDENIGALLASLRTVACARGSTETAVAAGMKRKGLQKALSEQGNPKFECVNAIMHALGYRLDHKN
ncbi:addiction module antidote protein [Acaryochloris marina]|uniref:addiction module antidote protein n=1 Tax=Acaryochloris marina TaxID=155978 RepID=UPI001BAF8C1D|nr:addiction module antidote protein [Acaryochloris marina]QUY40409.1 putative addiction module antidote protein [Acaryochloris marina S15]